MSWNINKIEEMLQEIEKATLWSAGQSYKTRCVSCKKIGIPTCITPKGLLCVFCVQPLLRAVAERENLTTWPASQFMDTLSDGNFRWRLTLLWRFPEVLKLSYKKSPSNTGDLLVCLVRNLGYVQRHPLAQVVRQAACNACIVLGKKILPVLLQMCDPSPWQFYANVILAAGSIAPENKEVQALLERAAKDSNPEIRQYVLRAISEHKSSWTKEMLQSLIGDPDASIRMLAAKVAAHLKLDLNGIGGKGIPQLDTPEQKQIRELIDKYYTVNALNRLYANYLNRFFTPPASSLKKKDLTGALAIIYADKERFQRLLSYFPKDVEEILNILVWEGGDYDVKKFEKMFGSKIVKMFGQYYSDMSESINDSYLLFQLRHDYSYRYDHDFNVYLYLASPLRKVFKSYLSRPEGYNLISSDAIEKTDFIYEDNDQVLRQLKLLSNYIQQGNLKFSKNTDKILKSSIKQMADCCSIREFYGGKDKSLEYMRAQLIADLLIRWEIKSFDTPGETLKQLFDDFFRNRGFKRYQLWELLEHVKGGTYSDYSQRQEKLRATLFVLLRALPLSQWVSMENLIKYCSYRDVYLEVVDRTVAGRDLYYNKKYGTGGRYSGYARTNITGSLYDSVITAPFIKAVMFLFAAFGIVDIAYNLPENKLVQEKDNKYLSIFDGLQYIRITRLGDYILGIAKEYDIKIEEEEGAMIVLDERRLMINLEGKDILKALSLEKIADKLSDNHFRVDYNSFLRGCTTKQDIQQKVKFFKDQISSKPPQIWENFLEEIIKRINPLSRKKGVDVYKLVQDKELISLVARDKALKKYILKAEGYHILIDSGNLNKVKKRLGELGYFIDNI